MRIIGIVSGIVGKFKNKNEVQTRFEMVTDRGNGFYGWNGKIYHSDIVRACISPTAKAISKTVPKHIREGTQNLETNPQPYIKYLLQDPNPYMTIGQMLEKIIIQLELNNNAFIYINRDEDGYPNALYPVQSDSCEVKFDNKGLIYLRFYMRNGKTVTYAYADIIHLRQDYNGNDIFGESKARALKPLMEIVNTTDQGIVKAIKNSAIIRWLLKFTVNLKPEDIKKQTEDFAEKFLSTSAKGTGVAGVDAKTDAIQISPNDYVPNAAQMDRTTVRIYNLFGTNEKIVQNKFNEDEWNAYYEGKIEPILIQLSQSFTNKLFSKRERSFGNSIVFEGTSLEYASMSTKLNLVQFVDRGIMNPNEVRNIMNLPPIDSGYDYLRRLDTATVNKTSDSENGEGGEEK